MEKLTKEQLIELLKAGKVAEFNRYREENPDERIDFERAGLDEANLNLTDFIELGGTNLSGENFRAANLSAANLSGANLTRATLKGAHLTEAHLTEANLSYADLTGADLYGAILTGAHLSEAILIRANLTGANLREANLMRANLMRANLIGAHLSEANFDQARVGYTTFDDVDLSEAKGLESVDHRYPCTIGLDTIYKSRGQIPEVFLRGCGVSDLQIETAKLHLPDLSNDQITDILYKIHDLRARQAIQINPLFISYSHADGSFVDAMETRLNDDGIRFWRDIHDLVAGPVEEQIDRVIALNHTVLAILSENSVESGWVEHEVRRAGEIHKKTGRHVLCPIALDDSWKTCSWPKRLMEQVKKYNILDFSDWRTEDALQRMYGKLIDGLDMFYKESEMTAADLANSELVGMWADRQDITDSAAYARQLRAQSEQRKGRQ